MQDQIINNRFIELFQKKKKRNLRTIYEVMMGDHLDSPASQWLDDSENIVSVPYRIFDENVKSMAAFFRKKFGEKKLDSFVGMSMDNCHLWQVCFWALLMAGYRPVLVDINLKEEMVDYIIENAGITAIVGRAVPGLTSKVPQITLDELQGVNEAPVSDPRWADMLALCTSGTTATAKILVFDGAAIVSQVEGFYRAYLVDSRIATAPTPVKPLAFLPMHHVLGFITLCIAYPVLNTTIVFLKDRSPAAIQAACQKIGVTHMVSVPLLINNLKNGVLRKIRNEEPKKEKLLQGLLKTSLMIQKMNPKTGDIFVKNNVTKSVIKKLFGPTFSWICVGGTHVPTDSLKFMNGLGYRATIGYGMTECGIIAFESGRDFNRRYDGSTGPLMYGFESKVIDPDGRETLNGELLIRGASMHVGKMYRGAMVPADIDEDGWLHTGDTAHFDNGSLVIDGRVKEVILNESGENIYPDELEDYFDGIFVPVNRYCILGLNNKGNEEVALVAEVNEDARNERSNLEIVHDVNLVNSQLPVMKRIKRVYIANEPMPLANGIKVRRQKLKELLENFKFAVTELDLDEGPVSINPKAVLKEEKTGIKHKKPVRGRLARANEAKDGSSHNEKFLQIREQVLQCFAEVLDTTPEKIGVDMRFVEDLKGDSLDSLGLLAMSEARFGVMIEESDYYQCKTVNDVSRLLYEKLSGKTLDEADGSAVSSPGRGTHLGKAAAGRAPNVKPITAFKDSAEYKSYEARFESMKKSKNPYYIPHDSALRDTSVVNGKEVINFGSYNYLGLSGNPEVSRAAIKAIEKYGTSASGSRLLAGEKPLHQELEKEFAEWKHTEAALVLVGGHSTNVTFVGNFCNEKDLILYDVLSHNSIAQGIKLGRATSRLFPHNDYKAARAILAALRDKFEKVLLIIEGVYSMDGDIAPVPEFVKLKKEFGLFLMVDEAHSSCVIGENGEGVDEYFNLKPGDIDIKMGTLSKGLGTCGGFLAGKREIIDCMRYTLPGFIFSVGLSPALAAATLEAIRLIRRDNTLVKQLQENIRYFVSRAKEKGFNLCMAGESAVAPILVGKENDAFDLSAALLERGVFVPPAVYPAVPVNMARLRFCLTSCHNREQIDRSLEILKELTQKMKINLPD